MIIQNISSITLDLSFIPLRLLAHEFANIDDAYLYHPSIISLADSGTISVTANGYKSTTSAYLTVIDLDKHSKDLTAHHQNKNDPTTNEKEAMAASLGANGNNPFGTVTQIVDSVAAGIAEHLSIANHQPPELTSDELDAIQASSSPASDNQFITLSAMASDVLTRIATHTANASAHHSNTNDLNSTQKAGIVATTTLSGSNPATTMLDFNNHVGTPTAHHTNANDLSSTQKAGIDAASPALTGANPVITAGNSNLLTTNQKAGIAAASPVITVSNPVITAGHVNLLTTDQKAAVTNATGGAATGANPLVTTGDTRLATTGHLSTDQKAALDGASPAITGANPVISASTLTTHSATATAHHSNTNDPTTNEKAGIAGLTGADPAVKVSELTAHTAVATAHHSNANDPTSDQKAAMGSGTGANPFVLDDDSRLTDSRTPVAHAANHTDGSDDIQSATVSQKGVLASADYVLLLKAYYDRNDVQLQYETPTSIKLAGVKSKLVWIKDSGYTITSKTVATSATTIIANGNDSGVAPSANTLYYVYLSNSAATFAPEAIRLSLQAPSYADAKYVLGGSGNALNWMLVGYTRTDSSIEFSDEFAVCSYYNRTPLAFNYNTVTVGPVSLPDVFETLTGLTQSLIIPPYGVIKVDLSATLTVTNPVTAGYLGINDRQVASGILAVSSGLAGSRVYTNTTTAPIWYTVTPQHMYSIVGGSSTVSQNMTVLLL